MLKLKIAYLYPDILQGYCDEANVNAFYKRAIWRNIEVEIEKITINDRINPAKYDFYYIGGSNTEMLFECNKYLKRNKRELKIAFESKVPILAVNLGYVMMGKTIQSQNKIMEQGLELLDIHSFKDIKHYSKIIGKCEFLKEPNIVGFSCHEMISDLEYSANPFLELKKGFGNNEKEKNEGCFIENLIGTYITSPILAQNPYFCDYLISNAIKTKYRTSIALEPLCDDIEWFSHNYLLVGK